MTFYYPLRLGVETQQPARKANSVFPDEQTGDASYDAWREGVELLATVLEPKSDASVLEQICNRQNHHTTLIVGEPGSGKTRLLEHWFGKCLENVQALGADSLVPVFVRLRQFSNREAEVESALHSQTLKTLFWNEGLSESVIPEIQNGVDYEFIYQQEHVRHYRTVWLLDGLDEIEPVLFRNPKLFQQISRLPGHRIITCRTATHQGMRREERRYLPLPLTLLPLTRAEQRDFLHQIYDSDPHNSTPDPDALHREINAHSQLRPLAGNPQLLDIMGRLVGLPLPATRYDLFERSVTRLWDKIDDPKTLVSERDSVLRHCAEQTGIKAVQFPLGTLETLLRQHVTSTDVRTAREELRHSGLIRFLDNSQCEFVHLTFHEFFLAQALILNLDSTPPDSLIREHWQNPRLEETLALVLSHQLCQGDDTGVLNAINRLIDHGQYLWKNNRQALLEIGRSPLRTALHLMHRCGINLQHYRAITDRFVQTMGDASQMDLMKLAISFDQRTPATILSSLAGAEQVFVRQGVAGNDSTSPETLQSLATDEHNVVRESVARNIRTPVETLTTLATTKDANLRRCVAGNAAISEHLQTLLASDTDTDVLCAVAANPATVPDVMESFATSSDSKVRWHVACNTNIPSRLLTSFAVSEDAFVRHGVASNTRTSADLLNTLATDEDIGVLHGVVTNPCTPVETLKPFAVSKNRNLRRGLASNASTPPELLTSLATDDDADVRSFVASNTSTPSDTLSALVIDPDADVRRSVAINTSTPSELLTRLATDSDDSVHQNVALNTSTVSETLASLASSRHDFIRLGVAGNKGTPPETLATLATDPNQYVRLGVSWNLSTLLESL